MRKLLLFSIVIMFSSSFLAQSQEVFFKEADIFFKQYVKAGNVAYAKIHKSPEKLINLLDSASKIRVSIAEENTFKAFWINVYNLSVIKGIIDNYPINSPLDKKGFFDKTKYLIAGEKHTLNSIENNVLRANFDDARIHFVLVCGAKGCPPLINEAYTPENLELLLNLQTTNALNNSQFLRVKKSKIELSEIFKWYREDFGKSDVEVLQFINKYRENTIETAQKIVYYTYNWKLNKQ